MTRISAAHRLQFSRILRLDISMAHHSYSTGLEANYSVYYLYIVSKKVSRKDTELQYTHLYVLLGFWPQREAYWGMHTLRASTYDCCFLSY